MKLRQFNKSRKQKRILIGSFLGIIVLVGSILLYRSYALYKEEKTFNVIRGKVPSFVNGDLEIAIMVDGESTSALPSKGSYDVSVLCDKGATGYWDYEEWGPNIRTITTKTKCTIQFRTNFSQMLINKSQNDSTIEKIDHEATKQTPALTDYRYVGAKPNNYVYFGCSDTCTEDNLYRIIGVISVQSSEEGKYEERVKLIKAINWDGSTAKNTEYSSSGKGYMWTKNTSMNWWSTSPLNATLNEEFYNSLGDYKEFIDLAKWYLGEPKVSGASAYTPEGFYVAERNTAGIRNEANIVANVGLLYPSDYGYSIGKEYQDQSIYTNREKYVSSAWLYNLSGGEYYEWTITPDYDNDYTVWAIRYPGSLSTDNVTSNLTYYGVRPTFYLKWNVKYKSGDGSPSSPYLLKID